MISVEEITVTGLSGSSESKIILFAGLLTRAMQRAFDFFFAIRHNDEIVFVVARVGHDHVGAATPAVRGPADRSRRPRP